MLFKGDYMYIKAMTPNHWKPLSDDLLKRLKEQANGFGVNRIIRTYENTVELQNGKLPIVFNVESETFRFWGRGSRYAGDLVSIDELQQIEAICKEWRKDNLHNFY
jgi:hypothetical protein